MRKQRQQHIYNEKKEIDSPHVMDSLNNDDSNTIWNLVQETHGSENKSPAWLSRQSQESCDKYNVCKNLIYTFDVNSRCFVQWGHLLYQDW